MKNRQLNESKQGYHGHGRKQRRHQGRSPRGRLFAGGELRLALLDLLSGGAAHGYELMQRLSDRTEGRYQPSAGATYPILQQLLDEGLAEVEADNSRKVYCLTSEGMAEIANSADELQAIWQRAATWGKWRGLNAPELADLQEVRDLFEAVLAKARDGLGGDDKDRIKSIVANATEKIRKM